VGSCDRNAKAFTGDLTNERVNYVRHEGERRPNFGLPSAASHLKPTDESIAKLFTVAKSYRSAGPGPFAAYPGGLYQSAVIGVPEVDGSILYLCAGWTVDQPNWHAIYTPGKFSKSLGTCSVAVNGKEVLVAGGYSFLIET
jgi:hypothetical protein